MEQQQNHLYSNLTFVYNYLYQACRNTHTELMACMSENTQLFCILHEHYIFPFNGYFSPTHTSCSIFIHACSVFLSISLPLSLRTPLCSPTNQG